MKNIITLVSILLCFNANSAVKEYQNILINEKASLLDLTMFKASMEADKYEKELDYTFLLYYMLKDVDSFDWSKKWDKKSEFILPMLTPEYVNASFDFENGKFIFEHGVVWKLYLSSEVTEENPIKLETTQSNIALVCKLLLKSMGEDLMIEPLLHSGYSTKESRKLSENIFEEAIKDTLYKVKIKLNRYIGSFPYLTCEADRANIFSEDGKVKYEYSGNWHEFKKLIKEVRTTAGFTN